MNATQILSILTIMTALLVGSWWDRGSEKDTIRIGLIQTASHPALDAARESFIAEIEQQLDGPVRWITQNAEGSMSQMATIAKSYASDSRMQAVYAIGTPAVQMINRMAPKKPLLYAAISDPGALNLGSMACGTSDWVDVSAQAKLIQMVLPQAKRVAILLNPAEHNSNVQVARMEKALSSAGLATIRIGVHVQSDITTAVASASRQADLILIPADNLLVSAMPLLAKTALRHKIPLIVSDTPSVTRGALLAKGVDYKDCGRRTAELALLLLVEGKTPSEIGRVDPENKLLLVNRDTQEALGIQLPDSVKAQAVYVRTGGDLPCR
jgi:putative ABC transport system substrate-binding protein